MKYYFRYSSTEQVSSKYSAMKHTFGLLLSRTTGNPVESYYATSADWIRIDTDNANFNTKITYWEF